MASPNITKNDSIILSVHPKYIEKILSGKKKYELRKCIHKRKTITKVILYSTAPVSLVVGEFTIKNILKLNIIDLWKKTKRSTCVNEEFFLTYFKDRDFGYALEIDSPIKYCKTYDLSYFGLEYAPQSFVYIEPNK